ncbi:MAG: ATPase [Mycobacteriaceae bacterium]|nr:ATPase [Mycobacterium sp.]NBP84351.1 ATPase [Mycobacteriaceae bacterium]NBQ42066.1 ATPase [Mycobacteriaceae bacterium]
MSTLGELLAEHTVLPGSAVDHLHALVSEWQLLADMSFGDFLMWVRRDDGALVCVAQCRPNTASTLLHSDAVGTVVAGTELPLVARAFASGEIGHGPPPADPESRAEVVPVRCRDGLINEVVAVLTHQTSKDGRRTSSRLEKAYLDCARSLLRMLAEGTFPAVGDPATSRSSPRVGDGFIRLDVDGRVAYASPNALSAYHRMGLTSELEGHHLLAVTRPLISDTFEAQELAAHLESMLGGGTGMRLEIDAGGAAVLMRTLPLSVGGTSRGAVVLIRDVTEVKRADRALLSKDATIREIHHRVKNNLQTVAALLRLQARRTDNLEARDALMESVRRVAAIAEVHEALSMSVDEEVNLDAVMDRILPIINDVARVDTPVRISREGALGILDADRATALVMVITEVVQNAIQHAFGPQDGQGRVVIRAERSARWLDVVVHDDGRGLPDGFSLDGSERLGLQIVRTLVSADLDGTLTMRSAAGGGTDVLLRLPIGRRGQKAAAPA